MKLMEVILLRELELYIKVHFKQKKGCCFAQRYMACIYISIGSTQSLLQVNIWIFLLVCLNIMFTLFTYQELQ